MSRPDPASGPVRRPALLRSADMSLSVAEGLLGEVKRQAESRGIALSAVVVDRGGNPVASMRMDLAQLGAGSLAMDKATTAASFGLPTAAWSHSSTPGGSDWGLAHSLGGRAIVFPGGVPVFASYDLVGALGVSGAASEVDQACAEAAVTAQGLDLAPPGAP